MNNFSVEIYNADTMKWEDFTKYAVFPLKIGNFLDEQLDEAEVTLKKITNKYFLPLTRVRLTLICKPNAKYSDETTVTNRASNYATTTYNNATKKIIQTKEMNMIVASDNAIEYPVGSGKYNHQIYLIEQTKILEGYIGDALSFTNPLGNNFTGA